MKEARHTLAPRLPSFDLEERIERGALAEAVVESVGRDALPQRQRPHHHCSRKISKHQQESAPHAKLPTGKHGG